MQATSLSPNATVCSPCTSETLDPTSIFQMKSKFAGTGESMIGNSLLNFWWIKFIRLGREAEIQEGRPPIFNIWKSASVMCPWSSIFLNGGEMQCNNRQRQNEDFCRWTVCRGQPIGESTKHNHGKKHQNINLVSRWDPGLLLFHQGLFLIFIVGDILERVTLFFVCICLSHSLFETAEVTSGRYQFVSRYETHGRGLLRHQDEMTIHF